MLLEGGLNPQGFLLNYTSTDTIPYFKECDAAAKKLGYILVELQVVPQKGNYHISAVIASSDSKTDIGVSDCAKVHRALQDLLIPLLETDEDSVYMEVSSPGMERNIKNAAEFSFFKGREIRVWDKTKNDWVPGMIHDSDEQSLTLETEGGELLNVAYENIAKAKFIHL